MNEPFRSRPRIRRQPEPPSQPSRPQRAERPDDDIIEGVIEDEQALVPVSYPSSQESPPRAAYADYSRPVAPIGQPRRGLFQREISYPGMFLVALGLMAAGVFFTLLQVADLPDVIMRWWPVVSLAIAGAWSLMALARRNPTAFLGGSAVAGLSISLLLDAQEVAAFEESFVGVILITLGLAIIVRGLLLRQSSPA